MSSCNVILKPEFLDFNSSKDAQSFINFVRNVYEQRQLLVNAELVLIPLGEGEQQSYQINTLITLCGNVQVITVDMFIITMAVCDDMHSTVCI